MTARALSSPSAPDRCERGGKDATTAMSTGLSSATNRSEGPFTVWRHCHRVVSIGVEPKLYQDRVEYAVPGGPLAQRLTRPLLRHLLSRLFAWRHRIVTPGLRRVCLRPGRRATARR